jgi:large subunit ribosomal protein L15
MTSNENGNLTIRQHDLCSPDGSRKKRIRVGRGNGSGRGTYSGRGVKGQQSRSGPGQRHGMEGWQLPWIKGMPKIRGFNRPYATQFSIINIKKLEARFSSGETVNPEELVRVGLVRKVGNPIKILGEGELTKNLIVSAHKFSLSAKTKLVAAGGTVTEIPDKHAKPEQGSAS